MADNSKAQKLACARKKVNKYKKLKEEKKNSIQRNEENVDSNHASKEQTPIESLTNSTHSSLNNEPQQQQNSQLPNYFNNNNMSYENNFQQTASFFDNFVTTTNSNPIVENFPIPIENLTQLPPNIESNLHNYFNDKDNNVISPNENQRMVIETNSEVSQDNSLPPPQHSTVESLLQLSKEMEKLIEPNSEYTQPSAESELEKRNQELAMLLQQEKIKTEQLTVNLQEYQAKFVQLEHEIQEKNIDNKSAMELSHLQEELQSHIQTVGILVAEKTELSANLSQFQLISKQKTTECEELQGRLKASRTRVSDLEREINNLKQEKLQFNNLDKQNSDNYDKLQNDYQQLKQEKDELMQDLLETREKLKSSSEMKLTLQQQINEFSGQLSMANIKIQQLTNGELNQIDGQIEKLTQDKFLLEKQIADLNQTLKSLSKERDESNLQYHQYAQQLNARLANLANKVDELQQENESLQIQGQNRIKHISELEKQLQNLQNDQISFTTQKNQEKIRKDLEIAVELSKNLQLEKEELEENCGKLNGENEMLIKELEMKKESITHLEDLIEGLRKNQPDNIKLLATMESDKVAASRAILQNTELKKQMDGMQEVFMKLSNDKVELTDKLTTEQHNNKELLEKLQKTELHLQTLADAIAIKDNELSHLRNSSNELDKQVLHTEQLTDRLRHYEAQDHNSHSLQLELQEAKQTITTLTNEMNKFKENNKVEEENKNVIEFSDGSKDNNHDSNWNILDKESAMKSLEKKFMRTMEDIATLTEEKQRLEHLVLQLQGETETIGEYVALYQYQRSLLKQKAIEKDQQLTQLAEDRELIKIKLERLNDLIKKLVIEKGTIPSELLQSHENSHELCEEHAKIHDQINKITDDNPAINSSNNLNEQNTETATQIIALLSEIKSSNLVQPTENFHHCPWCSGQLITV